MRFAHHVSCTPGHPRLEIQRAPDVLEETGGRQGFGTTPTERPHEQDGFVMEREDREYSASEACVTSVCSGASCPADLSLRSSCAISHEVDLCLGQERILRQLPERNRGVANLELAPVMKTDDLLGLKREHS
jgi:hypothetical protein